MATLGLVAQYVNSVQEYNAQELLTTKRWKSLGGLATAYCLLSALIFAPCSGFRYTLEPLLIAPAVALIMLANESPGWGVRNLEGGV